MKTGILASLVLAMLWLGACANENAEPFADVKKQPVPSSRVDSFGLPLEIKIEVPPVPPEISRPSKPLPQGNAPG